MIHRIEVDGSTEPQSLRKLFRKKLMTGGAVIRLNPECSSEDLRVLLERFSPEATAHSLYELVLVSLAGRDGGIDARLRELDLPGVQRALEQSSSV